MVSRGGRSKGCSHCRRRRIKCDENRPTCGQCLKNRLDCDGPKDMTWIQTIPKTQTIRQEPKDAVVKVDDVVELSLKAFESNICLSYARKHLLRGGLIELAFKMIGFDNGSTKFETNPGLSLLRQSLSSLSVTYFGSKHRQSQITKKGYLQYGEVLKKLNHHLARPERQLTDETVLTASSCMLFEIFLPTGPTNFLKHQRGIDTIMELRGPPTESTGPAIEIFHGLRILSILGALADSRPSFYSKQEWKQIPPARNAEAALLQRRIFDVLADCTHLKSQRDILLTFGATPEAIQTISVEVQRTLDDLEALYPLWETLDQSQLALVEEQTAMAKGIGVANHISATAYMLYNTAYMCILQIQDSLSPSPDYAILRRDAALKIAKCLELKEYEQRVGAPESNTIAFVATRVAWHALGGYGSSEGHELARVVQSTANGYFKNIHESYQENFQTEFPSLDKTLVGVAQIPDSDCTLNDNAVIKAWDVSVDLFNLDYEKPS